MEDAIALFEGTWVGSGTGIYPTIETFQYRETDTLARLPGKPILFYTQRTQGTDGRPLHAEAGYFRFKEEGYVEFVLAQPTGITEIHHGRINGGQLVLEPCSLGLAPTAVEVTEVRRRFEVDGDVMRYELTMAAVGQPLQLHLEAELLRQPGQTG